MGSLLTNISQAPVKAKNSSAVHFKKKDEKGSQKTLFHLSISLSVIKQQRWMEKKEVELINLLPSQVEFFVFHLCWQTLTWLVYAHFPIPFLSTQSSLIVFDVFNHRAQLVSFSSSSRPIASIFDLALLHCASFIRLQSSRFLYPIRVDAIAHNNHRRCVCFFFFLFLLVFNWSA